MVAIETAYAREFKPESVEQLVLNRAITPTFVENHIHTHPGKGSPLSSTDISSMQALNSALGGIGDGQRLSVYTIPIKNEGNILFRSRIFPPDE